MIAKDNVNDNISSNHMIIFQSPKVIATLTIMIIATTIIIIITTKIRATTTINSIDFTKIGHHLVLHSKSAPDIYLSIYLSICLCKYAVLKGFRFLKSISLNKN